MKRLLLLPLVALLFAGCEKPTEPEEAAVSPSLQSSHTASNTGTLISYWKFDDGAGPTAADAVGAHPGTLVNGPVWTTGQVGGALHFDGVDDYVDAGYGYTDLGKLLTFTLEAWVKWDGGDGFYSILAKPAGRGLPGYEYGYGFQLNSRYAPSPDGPQLWGWSKGDGWWPWAKSAQSIPKDTWTHVAVTCQYVEWRTREYRLYIDGTEALIGGSDLGATILGDPVIYIGAGGTGGLGNYFAGVIDEVAIHGSVLPPEEIRRHYENGLRGLGYENQPPIADPGGPYLGGSGLGIPFNGSGSWDPDGDVLTFDWDWGDQTSSPDVGETPTHIYEGSDIYQVCLTVSDGDLSEQACTFGVVYDPSAGFVTGGGWIDSPEGAYGPDHLATSKATFGFVSKYKKGATVPTGNTEFQFHAAGMNFHSSSYDWLVVTGSDYARFKGAGTVNGAMCEDSGDPFKFQLWAGDGDPDTFRIRIWCEDEESEEETDLYDNGFDQAIGGGSIVIHTK